MVSIQPLRCVRPVAVTGLAAALLLVVLPLRAQLAPQVESIASDVAKKISKIKVRSAKGSSGPRVIVLGSLYEEELTAALYSRAGNYDMDEQGCAHKLIADLKLPPREYLHSTAAAWIARQCGAQLVVIAGWERGPKEGQRRLNVALIRADKSASEGFWTADLTWEASPGPATAAADPVALSESPSQWRSLPRAGKDGVTVPQCVSCPNPTFTDEAVKAKIYSGRVMLRVGVTAEGNVGDIELIEGAAFGLNEQAINAVRKWKMKPSQDPQGNAVAAWAMIEVNFYGYGPYGEHSAVVPRCDFCPNPRLADCKPKKLPDKPVVLLRMLINTNGQADGIRIVKGIDPCLDQRAIEVVRTWRFTPVRGPEGMPVPVWTTVEINFRKD